MDDSGLEVETGVVYTVFSIIIHGRHYQLLDLVRGIKRKNRQAAVNTGAPRGKEAW
jgi:hypothetical protein